MASGGKFGWFLGLLFGTLFGVLFAPRRGKDLREKIKADRKKGRWGIAPLQDDFKLVGKEIANVAKEIYESDEVREVVEKGKDKLRDLSEEFYDRANDFQVQRIEPAKEMMAAHFKKSKETFKKAQKELSDLSRKTKRASRIGKHAIKEIKRTFKK